MMGGGFPCSLGTQRAHLTLGRALPALVHFSLALDRSPEAPLPPRCLLPQQEEGAAQLAREQFASQDFVMRLCFHPVPIPAWLDRSFFSVRAHHKCVTMQILYKN